MKYRITRNKSRIGKRWLIVGGDYCGHMRDGGPRWRTSLQVSEHDTKEAAETALHEYNLMLTRLRIERDAAAARGDHAAALILNDRISSLKDGGSVVVERIMRQFESTITRQRRSLIN